MTREKEVNKVRDLLDKRILKAINLIDSNNITSEAYFVESLPQTFVIGENGSLLWKGHYADLTDKLLKELITTQQSQATNDKVVASVSNTDKFIFRLNLSAEQDITNWGKELQNSTPDKYGRYAWQCKSWSMLNFFGLQLCGFTPARILSNKPDFKIDLEYFCDTSLQFNKDEFLKKSLSTMFNFSYSTVQKDTLAWVLKVTDENLLLRASVKGKKSGIATNKKEMIFAGQPLSAVCGTFEITLKDLFEERNIGTKEQKFDFTIPVYPTMEQTNNFLKATYGFYFERGNVRTEFIQLKFNN